ncbi:hypothetical protein ISS40_03090 [Candidatus Bathyarchaeota archaeon]|nr:hypothetical protein [Candidatus Bathyarchaeota archaeon]MBL7167636.1 hypothetical protein [Candidatus Bathyarchaeota archaeon]
MEAAPEDAGLAHGPGPIEEYSPKNLRDKRTTYCYKLTQKGENVIQYFKRAEDLIELEITPRARL